MKQYLDLLSRILEAGDAHQDRTNVGTTSIFGYQMRFDLQEGFPLLTTKRLPFRWIFEELAWFLSGSTYEPTLRQRGLPGKLITIWEDWATHEKCDKFQRVQGDLGPVYGHTWRNFGATFAANRQASVWKLGRYSSQYLRHLTPGYDDDGTDQIRNVLEQLAVEPRSRRIIVVGYDPREAHLVALPPCHSMFQFKWHEESNRLDLQLYQRSADVFLGVPFNIASYALLLTLMANLHGMIPGEFVHTFGDVHIYNNHREQVQKQLARTPRTLPQLTCEPVSCVSTVDRLRYLASDLNYEVDIKLHGYDPHPVIKAPVAV